MFEATGVTIAFASGFVGELHDFDIDGFEREMYETSHQGTTSRKTFKPKSLVDPGTLAITFAFEAEKTPPIDSAPETITITFPSAGAGGTSSWAASGFMTKYKPGGKFQDRMMASAELKFSGAITITP